MASSIRLAAHSPNCFSSSAVDRRPVEVGVGHPGGARHQRLERLLGRRDAGDRQRALGGAVVGDGPRDHLGLLGLADQLEVLLGQLPGRLDRLAAAGGEEHLVQIARGARRPAGRPAAMAVGMGVGPDREVRQLAACSAAASASSSPAVPDLDDEQAGQPVQVSLAVGVVDVGALAALDGRHRLVRVGRHPGEVHPQVVAGGVGQPLGLLAVVADVGLKAAGCHAGTPVVGLLGQFQVDERLGAADAGDACGSAR